jgi:hypothetical protein
MRLPNVFFACTALVILVLSPLAVPSQAAYFSYYGGYFEASTESTASVLGVNYPTKSDSQTGLTYTGAVSSSLVLPSWTDYQIVTGNTVSYGATYFFVPNSEVYFQIKIDGAYAATDSSASLSSSSHCRSDDGSNAFYLQLTPSAGENLGDPVYVNFTWTGWAAMMTGWTGHLTGSTASEDIRLTLNDYTGSGSVLWSHLPVTVNSGETFSQTATDVFLLHVGDILGIHLGGGADADVSGYHYDPLTGNLKHRLDLEARTFAPLPPSLVLFGSGMACLGFLNRFRRRS